MTASQSQGEIGIERMCQLAGIGRSGYYGYWQRSAPRQEETGLRDAIQRLALKHRHYGYRRIGALLRREGWQANHKRVLRLMREDNLLCLRQTPFVPTTTNSRHNWCVVPNLTRGIVLNDLDQLWVADITYLRLAEEFGYLAVILDAFSRKVVGWELQTHLRVELATSALMMAITARQPKPGSLIHHSDRGVQYASSEYTELLAAHDIRPSMSRVGNPYDNAKAESFMKTLKQEEINGSSYRNLSAARSAIGAFIETVYNCQRIHSALDYRSPDEYEATLGRLPAVTSPSEVSITENCY